jgi:release factor glutamine methyltransferase
MGGFDCIVSNPPYIKTADIQGLQKEIKDYEPVEALDGGEDGLNFYRKILNRAGDYLNERGVIILEIGFGQADDVLLIARSAGFSDIRFIEDYARIKRVCVIRK